MDRAKLKAAAEKKLSEGEFMKLHPSTIIALLKELDEAEKETAEWEEKEAAVCPEDFGFEEYITSLQAENTSLREVLGMDKPEPVTTTLDILADAADILMATDYDAHGYEVICHARDNARKHIKVITQALTQKGNSDASAT